MKTALQKTIFFVCLLFCAGIVRAEDVTLTTEICYNGIDDNGDGLVDSDDPLCKIIRVSTTADIVDGNIESVEKLKNNPGADGLISLREAITATQSANNRNEFHTIGFALKNFDLGHFYYQDDGLANQVSEVNKVRTTAIDDSTINDKDPDFPRSWFQFFINSPLPAISDNLLIDGYDLRQTQPNQNEFGTTLNTAIRVALTANGDFPIFTINESIDANSELIIRGLCMNGTQEVIKITEGNKGNIWLYGNFLGTTITALSEVNTTQNIISVATTNRPIIMGSNRDGMKDEQEINLLAGVSDGKAGIYLENTQNVTISHNYFGVGMTGNNPLNNRQGTAIFSKKSRENIIDKNIISFFENGIQLENAESDSISHNLIGTNTNEGNNSVITEKGGNCTNCEKVVFYKNEVANSSIGWDFQGVKAAHFIENKVFNHLTIGLDLSKSSPDGMVKNEENFIYKNTFYDNFVGILIGENADNNALIQNSIYHHGNIGIDIIKSGINTDGINENDEGDSDTGVNQLLNFPTLSVINYTITEATVAVNLDIDDTFSDHEGYRIEFFANRSSADRGGEIYLGYLEVNGDITNAEVTLPLPNSVTKDYQIAATTSIIKYAAFTNLVPEIAFVATSELSASVPLPVAEICDNNIDDDSDGLIDCNDPDCGNYAFAGEIFGNEEFCEPFIPIQIENISTPFIDDRIPVFYQWEKSTDSGENWVAINDANKATYTPTEIFTTTQYRRLVKKYTCNDWLISNVIEKKVKSIPIATIIAPLVENGARLCEGTAYDFAAEDGGAFANYEWHFGAFANEDTVYTQTANITFAAPENFAAQPIILAVEQDGCYNSDTLTYNIHPLLQIAEVSTTQPTTCGGADGTIMVEMEENVEGCFSLSIDGGENYLPINELTESDLSAGAYHLFLKDCVQDCPVDIGIVTLSDPTTIRANDDEISGFCPGVLFQGTVVNNDTLGNNPVFSIAADATYGRVTMMDDGRYTYTPIANTCGTDQFSYQVCNGTSGCCDFAVVNIIFGDNQVPVFNDLPVDITIGLDDEIPAKAEVTAADNCPSTQINFREVSTQTNTDCGQYNYTITRTWTASDQCGNSTTHVQTISVVDETAPDVFRIHTLPNGKKMVAGVMEFTSEHWKTVYLPYNFSDNPLIFTQLVTNNEETTATVRLRKVSQNQFQIKLQEAASDDGIHAKESVAWMATENGEQLTDFHWQADTLSINHTQTTINFNNSFANIPLLFANMQTTNDEEAATVRNNGVNWNNGKVRIQEENSLDADLTHTAETLAYLAIDNEINLTNQTGEIFGETGKATVTDEWQTIFLNHTYHNPVVIANSLTIEDFDPATVQVRFVTAKSFQVRVAEWDYLDGSHGAETVDYLLMEGSLPLEVGDFCNNNSIEIDFSNELIGLDNTGEFLTITYDERLGFSGTKQVTFREWSAVDVCGNVGMATQEVFCPGIAFQAKTILQGALLGSNEPNLMRDDLRKLNLIPLTEPYTELAGFEQIRANGGEELKPTLLEIEGADAIVDWVFLELRNRHDKSQVIATTVGLVQRDGDIISHRGDSILTFPILFQNEYYVSVRHRNHVCMISRQPHIFTSRNIPMLDFTNPNIAGVNTGTQMENKNVMWAGDLNQDNKIIYQGPNNDIFNLFLDVLTDPENTKKITNFVSERYSSGDFNLDGKVLYQGPDNDRSALLFNTILVHPENVDFFTNFILGVGEKD